MADGVHAAMNAVEVAGDEAVIDGPTRYTHFLELDRRDHAVLRAGEIRNPLPDGRL